MKPDPGVVSSATEMQSDASPLAPGLGAGAGEGAGPGAGEGEGGYGFRAALVPYLLAQGERTLAQALQSSLPTHEQQRSDAPAYYAQMLTLFADGWAEGRYRFAADGRLQPRWR